MAFFSHRNDGLDVHGEIAALRREMSALSRSMSRDGEAALRNARERGSDLYEDVSGRIADALPAMRRRAHDLEETIRDNPGRTLAVVGLAALVVAAAVMLGGRR